MPKLIFRSNYWGNEPAVHKANYIKYLGTREGVEFDPRQLPRFFYEDEDMHGKKKNYIDYISGRPGAVHTEGHRHGLFTNIYAEATEEKKQEVVNSLQGKIILK